MKTRLIAAMICLGQVLSAGGPASTKATVKGADEIELSEAYQGALIRMTLTGKENGQRVELDIARRLSMPMIILIPKGVTRLGGDDSPEVLTEANIRVDLTAKAQAQVTLKQSGSRRITQGKQSMEACFNATTGKILKRLKGGREILFEQVIAQLGEKETYKRKLAAKALGEAGDAKALPGLRKLAQSDPDEAVRGAAQEAIAQIH